MITSRLSIRAHLAKEFGPACRDRYWAILEDLFVELGYRDYLGALQRYRVEHPQDMDLLSMSSFLVDYPFANRLYPHSLDVLARFRGWGPTVLLTDGDVVFQPRKVERSGLSEAVDSQVLIYIHKELGAGRCRAALPGTALRVGRRQATHSRCCEKRLGQSRDHGLSSTGTVCT